MFSFVYPIDEDGIKERKFYRFSLDFLTLKLSEPRAFLHIKH